MLTLNVNASFKISLSFNFSFSQQCYAITKWIILMHATIPQMSTQAPSMWVQTSHCFKQHCHVHVHLFNHVDKQQSTWDLYRPHSPMKDSVFFSAVCIIEAECRNHKAKLWLCYEAEYTKQWAGLWFDLNLSQWLTKLINSVEEQILFRIILLFDCDKRLCFVF